MRERERLEEEVVGVGVGVAGLRGEKVDAGCRTGDAAVDDAMAQRKKV